MRFILPQVLARKHIIRAIFGLLSIQLFIGLLVGQNVRIPNRKQLPHQSGPNNLIAPVSDNEAVAALQKVLEASGGSALWKATSSVKQVFVIVDPDTKTQHTLAFLDDWSLSSSRYRRRQSGSTAVSNDHNGTDSFEVKLGDHSRTLPEFDQARLIVSRLPAAAAEIVLRRKEYVVKVSASPKCPKTAVCVEVMRQAGQTSVFIPEQRWEISKAQGLPISVSIPLPAFGARDMVLWKTTSFAKFDLRDGLLIPSEITIAHAGGSIQRWTLISAKANPGFDVKAFDQEAGQ